MKKFLIILGLSAISSNMFSIKPKPNIPGKISQKKLNNLEK